MSDISVPEGERCWGRALSKAASLCLAAIPLLVGGLLVAEVVGWSTPVQQFWHHLELGPRDLVWPPPGTFLPTQPAATPGSFYPSGSFNGSVSRLVMFNLSQGLFQVELGTPTTKFVNLKNLREYITLAPRKSLPASYGVFGLSSWVENGIIAGTQGSDTGDVGGTVEVWDQAAVQQGSAARYQLKALGIVSDFLTLPGGGIIAGVLSSSGSLNVWPNMTSVQQQSPPLVLLPGWGVNSILMLASEAVVVGVQAAPDSGAVLIWSSVELLLQGLPATRTLEAPGAVGAVVKLPNGGLAAGALLPNMTGVVEVWLDSLAVEAGRITSRLISPSMQVTALLAVASGGLVAGVCAPEGGGGGLVVWPNTSSVLQGGPAPVGIAIECILSLEQLDGGEGAIAAGTVEAVRMWPNMASVLAGDLPTVTLQSPGQNNALLALQGGGLVAGALSVNDPSGGPGALHLWPYVKPLLHPAAGSHLEASHEVAALLPLADGGLVAGTCDQASGVGSVDVWQTLQATRLSQPPRSCVSAILELGGGGLAAGTQDANTNAATVAIWPNGSALYKGGGPSLQLKASGAVNALLNVSGVWLAAATSTASGSGTVDLWHAADLRQDEHPVASLLASGGVSTLIELPHGGVAAGVRNALTGAGEVDIWPNASCLFDGAPPAIRITVSESEFVNGLALLPSGAVVAGTGNSAFTRGSLYLWTSTLALLQGEKPLRLLGLDACPTGLAPLPFGGLAVSTFQGHTGQGVVSLWPERSWMLGHEPWLQLQTVAAPSLALLPGGGLAVGTLLGTVNLWPSMVSMSGKEVPTPAGPVYAAGELETGIALGMMTAQGPLVEIWLSQPPGGFVLAASVPVASTPLAILQFANGHLAVGTLNGAINLLTPSWVPAATLDGNGSVRALAPLPSGGFAAAADGTSSFLLLWSTLKSALAGQQPDQTVPLAFPPRALLWVEGSLLIGETKGVERWTPSGQSRILINTSGAVSVLRALPGGGAAIFCDDYKVQIWSVASDAVLGRPSDFMVAVPALAASIAVLEDGSLAAGGAVFPPVKCPAGEFSTGGRFLNCTKCRPGWLSEPGAASCDFSKPSSIAVAAGVLAVGLLLGLGTAQLLLFTVKRFGRGMGDIDVARRSLAAGAAAASMVSFSTMTGTKEHWLQFLSLWLGCGILFFAPHSDSRYLALGLLVLNLALSVQVLQAPHGQELLTVVGQLTGLAAGSGLLLSMSLLLAGTAYALPDRKALTTQRARPAPEEHPKEVWRGPSGTGQPLEMESFVTPPTRPRRCCRCSCLSLVLRAAAPVVRLASSFFGEHGLVLALGLVTVGQMSWQLTQNAATAAASTGLILLSVLVAVAQCTSSALAMLATCGCLPERHASTLLRMLDRHLRLAMVLKYVALGLKLLVLVLPFQRVETDVYLWWQCETPALCPRTCTKNRGGTCGTATSSSGNPVCICMAFEEAKLLILLNCLPAPFVSLGITVVNSVKYLRSENFATAVPFPKVKLLAQTILTVVPPVLQAIYFYLIYKVPATCLALLDVAIIIYPALLLGLVANEAKRALQGWGIATFSTIFSDSLLMSLRPLAVLVAALGAVAAAARAKGISADPWPDVVTDCSSTTLPWAMISTLLTMGSLAAASLGPIAAPETRSTGESGTEEPTA